MKEKIGFEGLTFDDILLVPARSSILPRDVEISSYLTREIKLNIPFLSAAMDTVTEAQMAIAMAAQGGIGIIHKNMSIEKQADEVDKVKRSESGMIVNPITLTPDRTIREAEEFMSKYHISGIPIVENNGKLVGILTNRDLRFETNRDLPVYKLMTKENLVTASLGTTLEDAQKILHRHRIEKLPVVDKKGIIKGLITYKDILKKKKFPFACKDNLGRLRVGAAVGVTNDTMDRVEALVASNVDILALDTAHGHSSGVLRTVKEIRKKYRHVQIVAGNIVTKEAALELESIGVDAVKVGIGAGSICTTRIVAGVGVPQISAVIEVANALKGKIPVISDGGIKQTGDVAKAIAAGADTVMMGGMLAGCDETPGEKVLFEGRSFKVYRGMGSLGAMKQGSSDRYFQDVEEDIKKLVPEGIEGRVPYKGTLAETVYQFIGGLRAAMGYCGAKNIAEFKAKTKFVKISNAGLRESHPHDVMITEEAPNYQTTQKH
ncbi:MAG: IMP dehydrogenase [Stygiobacter sp. RIFOXYC12_FULL_38_8]|nr:MAG: IMP dehydrogenase [Stygiobacter sp. GWC2_38_9]OGU79135.1 MAG: IMP dehydrogenase [Stygiobacter sp. RIFOXYA12_FULL_38_9]OGV08058.1 MAG: IMP dehydrogenase [Stygiobacter sp. RIFOXYB2_FULL_37_11]OGV15269.1 MAG: IMP dehydrogenase [Stygiobacter sp. RIFOXYC2_FULL_38_25]OGV18371.1 MAG: IMP dehydrogenase [Stygiobacter sp. RIFOXYA2_FULL_38_8]OGV30815.1 MAG: IMP dehydrogenase [Stygiobacter sp. RIFOXYC12_FULL_38_8]OGV79007.1 MAG: IMP dehydrogenase [Stygiobacter sp. GWF2_38_21]RJQ64308.1 MAG: IMP 